MTLTLLIFCASLSLSLLICSSWASLIFVGLRNQLSFAPWPHHRSTCLSKVSCGKMSNSHCWLKELPVRSCQLSASAPNLHGTTACKPVMLDPAAGSNVIDPGWRNLVEKRLQVRKDAHFGNVKALWLLSMRDGLHDGMGSTQEILQTLAEKDNAEMVVTALDLMHDCLRMDVRQYTLAISARARSNMWQQACGLFDSMPTASVQPNEFSFQCRIELLWEGRSMAKVSKLSWKDVK